MGVRIRSNTLTKVGLGLLVVGVVVYLFADRLPDEPHWLRHLDLAVLLLATVAYLLGRIQMLVGSR